MLMRLMVIVIIRELSDSHVGHVLAMASLSAYIMNRKLQPHLTEDTCSMCHEKEATPPCMHSLGCSRRDQLGRNYS